MENAFTEWFTRCVRVGIYPNPRDVEPGGYLHGKFDVFINVSDEYSPEVAQALAAAGVAAHWFPMGEEWGLSPSSIFGALRILWLSEKEGLRVYVHCHAGINRSQVVADCYYYARNKRHRPAERWHDSRHREPGAALLKKCQYQQLPPLPEMEAWLQKMGYAVTTPLGGWLDESRRQAGWSYTYNQQGRP